MTSICAIGQDKILVGFGDNSLVVLAIPTLNIVDLVECSWISKQAGDIVTVYVDEPGEKGYIYIGTTEGLLLVLEALEHSGCIRVCDYSVNWNEAGLARKMAISCIQMCPKVRTLKCGMQSCTYCFTVMYEYELIGGEYYRMRSTSPLGTTGRRRRRARSWCTTW